APSISKRVINKLKAKHHIKNNDFVFGMFARKEKFSSQYCALCAKLLKKLPNAKLILAGNGQNQTIIQYLKPYMEQNRAFIYGEINTGLLGYILHVGLDTFPYISGFSVMELMAKSKPIISMRTYLHKGNHQRLRFNELVFDDQNALIKQMIEFATSPDLVRQYGKKSSDLLTRQFEHKPHNFCKIIDEQIALIEQDKAP
ncbi:MAG: hypothetical protein AAF403_06645, partial [Pseudomonadota bacterium]